MSRLKEERELKKLKKTLKYGDAEECSNLAKKYYNENDDFSIKLFTRSISLISDNGGLYFNRGLCYFNKKFYEKALTDFDEAINLNPNEAEFYNGKGELLLEKAEYDNALIEFNTAIELKINYRYYHNKGLCYLNKNNYTKALGNFDESIKLNPTYSYSYNGKGCVYTELGKYNDALDYHNEAININKNEAEFYYNRGNCYFKNGDYDFSFDDYNNAIDLDEKKAVYYIHRSKVFWYKENYTSALSDFEKGIKLEKSDKLNNQYRILANFICLKSHNYDKARDYINQAFNNIKKEEQQHQFVYLENIKNAQFLYEKNQELEGENLEMRAVLYQTDRLAYLGRMATMMAHNIKNPVNNISTATTSLQMGIKSQKISPEKQIESLERILGNTKRLNETIEKFRNQAQNDRSEYEAINLNETLEDIFQLFFAGDYQLNGIETKKDYSTLNPIAITNKDSIQEILITLLNNAKEAVNQQTFKKVTLNTWQTEDKVGFNIEDNGGGIGDEKLDKLFTPFASSKIKGMGLGLYFCKQIVTDLEGDIDYYNVLGGAGFRITLPFSTENNHATKKI